MSVGPFVCPVVDEAKCLGFHVCCSGDVARNRSLMLGSMRGRMKQMEKKFSACPRASRARWSKGQFRGVINWHASFVGLSVSSFSHLNAISNGGARRIVDLFGRAGSHDFLTHLKSEHNVCLRMHLKSNGGDEGNGRIFPEHPIPILHAPRDNISCKDELSRQYRVSPGHLETQA